MPDRALRREPAPAGALTARVHDALGTLRERVLAVLPCVTIAAFCVLVAGPFPRCRATALYVALAMAHLAALWLRRPRPSRDVRVTAGAGVVRLGARRVRARDVRAFAESAVVGGAAVHADDASGARHLTLVLAGREGSPLTVTASHDVVDAAKASLGLRGAGARGTLVWRLPAGDASEPDGAGAWRLGAVRRAQAAVFVLLVLALLTTPGLPFVGFDLFLLPAVFVSTWMALRQRSGADTRALSLGPAGVALVEAPGRLLGRSRVRRVRELAWDLVRGVERVRAAEAGSSGSAEGAARSLRFVGEGEAELVVRAADERDDDDDEALVIVEAHARAAVRRAQAGALPSGRADRDDASPFARPLADEPTHAWLARVDAEAALRRDGAYRAVRGGADDAWRALRDDEAPLRVRVAAARLVLAVDARPEARDEVNDALGLAADGAAAARLRMAVDAETEAAAREVDALDGALPEADTLARAARW